MARERWVERSDRFRVVFRLLREVDRRKSAVAPAFLIYGPGAKPTPELEREFFAGMRLPNGTFKTTYDHRLDDLNAEINRHLPRDRSLRAKDVAVSSGISTVEWCDELSQAGIGFKMTATDILVRARLLDVRGDLRVLVDRDGRTLQVDVAGSRSARIKWAVASE